VNLHELVGQFIIDTRGTAAGGLFSAVPSDSSLGAFLPELTLCGTILLLLLVRLFRWGQQISGIALAFLGTAYALYLALPTPATDYRMEIFTGMLVYDPLTVFMRVILIGFAFLFTVFTALSGIPDREDSADVYTLVLGATLGMCLMASANHLLMIFLAVEMASVPSYALAGLLKGRRVASEAALKYSVFGAGAAGVMLYGISLVAGLVNSAHLPTVAMRLAEKLPTCESSELMVLALGGLMIAVGLAFKLSAVPFHFWCPDVFEGACAEVNAFLSVASKAAALALLLRVALGFGTLPVQGISPGSRSSPDSAAQASARTAPAALMAAVQKAAVQKAAVGMDAPASSGLFAVADAQQTSVGPEQGQETPAAGAKPAADVAQPAHQEPARPAGEPAQAQPAGALGQPLHGQPAPAHGQPAPGQPAHAASGPAHAGGHAAPSRAAAIESLAPARAFIGKLVALIAAITCTFGNLAAYGQTNIKRLLAYSTIAHAGYMMMPVSALMVMAARDPTAAASAVGGLAIYIAVYLFMNLGAFAIVAFLRNAMRSEQISDYAGLIRVCPVTVVCFSAILFGLIGIPPLAGFIGKFAIFAALADGYEVSTRAGQPAFYLIVLLVVGGLNTAVSLFYYLRIVKTMTIDEPPANRRPFTFPDVSLQGVYIWFLTAPTLLLILNWEGLKRWSEAAARHLLS
jgi:NADH-quinone oxidoreductase subunit N